MTDQEKTVADVTLEQYQAFLAVKRKKNHDNMLSRAARDEVGINDDEIYDIIWNNQEILQGKFGK